MKSIYLFTVSTLLMIGCSKPPLGPGSNKFKNPILIAVSDTSAQDKLHLNELTNITINDYFDFSKNSKDTLNQLSLEVKMSCLHVDDAITTFKKVPDNIYVHQLLSSEQVQHLVSSPMLCNSVMIFKSASTVHYYPIRQLAIQSLYKVDENQEVELAALESVFDFRFFSEESTRIVCDSLTTIKKNSQSAADVFYTLKQNFNRASNINIKQKKYYQNCVYIKTNIPRVRTYTLSSL